MRDSLGTNLSCGLINLMLETKSNHRSSTLSTREPISVCNQNVLLVNSPNSTEDRLAHNEFKPNPKEKWRFVGIISNPVNVFQLTNTYVRHQVDLQPLMERNKKRIDTQVALSSSIMPLDSYSSTTKFRFEQEKLYKANTSLRTFSIPLELRFAHTEPIINHLDLRNFSKI